MNKRNKSRIIHNIREKFIGYYRKCDFITMMSIVLALLGMILAYYNHFTISMLLLACCGLCDSFDGIVARKYKYSEKQKIYGGQLDSLADIIAFGIFPAFFTVLISYSKFAFVCSIFYILCGVIRLAYFNTLKESKESKANTFIGVPITTVCIVFPIIFLLTRIINLGYLQFILPITLTILAISYVLNINVPKLDVIGFLNKLLNKYVLNILLFPLFIIFISDYFYKLNFKDHSINLIFSTIFQNFLPFLLIFILILALYWFVIAILGNSRRAKILFLIVVALFLVVNDVKLRIMGYPVDLGDINFLNSDNAEMMVAFSKNMMSIISSSLVKSLYVILPGIALVILDKYKIFKFKSSKSRLGVLGASIILVLAICTSVNRFPVFVLNHLYNLSGDEILNVGENKGAYYKYGLYQGILLDDMAKKYTRPDGYDRKIAEDLINNSEKQDAKWGKANVVFILSESLFDVTNIEEITFDRDILTNIHNFDNLKNAMVTDLSVSAFGGGSVNSEFELLTGASMAFWKPGLIAYNQYYTSSTLKTSPHLMKEFNNNGYETMYITPWGEQSFHSREVYTGIGADTLLYTQDVKCKNKGVYCSDEDFFNKIYEQLEDTSEGNYKFIMSATGQNHGPYSGTRYDKYDFKIVKTSLDDELTGMLKDAAQGAYDADRTIYDFYNKIQSLKTPTIVVFFGDHLPYFNETAYQQMSYFNTGDESIDYLRMHTTKGLIFSNFDIDLENFDFINLSYLGIYVANNLDIKLSPYFSYIDSLKDKIPVFNNMGLYDFKKEKIIPYDKSGKNKDINNYRYVQYYSFYDY